MLNDKTVYFVTSNRHKAQEVVDVFNRHSLRVEVVYGKTVEIQSESLEEIALFSALQAYNSLGRPVFVEDAGLYIKGLGGFPGPYSSYVYKTLGVEGVLKLVEGVGREAVFSSVVCYYHSSTGPRLFKGLCRGRIASQGRGEKGFGFDPIFIPDGFDKTFAEMSVEEKNRYSHRGVAVSRLCRWLLTFKPSVR